MKTTLKISLIIFLVLSTKTVHCQNDNGWTIMYYAAGSNSSESDLLQDIDEIIEGKQSKGYEVITLIDRIKGFSNNSKTLGENFTDTKLYKFGANSYEELSGKEILPEFKKQTSYEANMGDADLLKRFIKYCKTYYPAKHYMLIVRSHGDGQRMCPEEEGVEDFLYPAELSDVLSIDESVEILGLDVCSMAGLENFYEWRPNETSFSAKYILASAHPTDAWNYKSIFSRLSIDTKDDSNKQKNHFEQGNEKNINPIKMTPDQFSKLLIEEIYDDQPRPSWGLFDNTKITDVKLKMDELARLLSTENSATIYSIIEQSSGYYHSYMKVKVSEIAFPYIDAYDFAKKISNNEKLLQKTRAKANQVCETIDQLVLHSYYAKGPLSKNSSFTDGKNGVYMIVPKGNKMNYNHPEETVWEYTKLWYSPSDQKHIAGAYGLYDWCSDGLDTENEKVDNFYEYLDFLFTKNDK